MAAKQALLAIVAIAALGLLAGCGNKEDDYKIEGPKASDNPSVGAPVSAGTDPGQARAPGASKGAPPAVGTR